MKAKVTIARTPYSNPSPDTASQRIASSTVASRIPLVAHLVDNANQRRHFGVVAVTAMIGNPSRVFARNLNKRKDARHFPFQSTSLFSVLGQIAQQIIFDILLRSIRPIVSRISIEDFKDESMLNRK